MERLGCDLTHDFAYGGAYGLEDVPLTGKFPNKRDERTINIHISSLASGGRWIVTVSYS